MGRGKVQIKKIENTTSRQVTFCKRKNGLLKKASELSLLCDAEVALLIFSNSGRLYEFANNSVKATIEKYIKTNEENMQPAGDLTECNHWQKETRKLKQQRNILNDSIRQLMGECLDSLSMKELEQIEICLQKGISSVRSKKNEMQLGEIENLRRRECLLLAENRFLRSKIEDYEGFSGKSDQLEASFSHLDMQNFLQQNTVGEASSSHLDMQNFLQENTVGEAEQRSQTSSVVIQTALQLG
jgi:MADS-box transcription factor